MKNHNANVGFEVNNNTLEEEKKKKKMMMIKMKNPKYL